MVGKSEVMSGQKVACTCERNGSCSQHSTTIILLLCAAPNAFRGIACSLKDYFLESLTKCMLIYLVIR